MILNSKKGISLIIISLVLILGAVLVFAIDNSSDTTSEISEIQEFETCGVNCTACATGNGQCDCTSSCAKSCGSSCGCKSIKNSGCGCDN